jgi:hypothetical protein
MSFHKKRSKALGTQLSFRVLEMLILTSRINESLGVGPIHSVSQTILNWKGITNSIEPTHCQSSIVLLYLRPWLLAQNLTPAGIAASPLGLPGFDKWIRALQSHRRTVEQILSAFAIYSSSETVNLVAFVVVE